MQNRRRLRNAPPLFGMAVLGGLAIFFGGTPGQSSAKEHVRLGYFPNVTHAPALVGTARGDFQKAMGDIAVQPMVFNAGPEEMEALLAKEIDLAYVGPGPAVNTFLKSKGRALKVLAGACEGGASLLARADAPIKTIADLDGKRVAVPQLGGTQDISLRHFLSQQGLSPREKGGTVEIMPIKNPDILSLFLRGELDAAWVPEPWATRLVNEAGAKRVVDERDLWPDKRFATTVLVGRKDYIEHHAAQVQAFLKAHVAVIDWLRAHPAEGQTAVNAELKRLTGKALPKDVIAESWSRLGFTADLSRTGLDSLVAMAADAGYLPPHSVDLAALLDTHFLENARTRVTASAR